MAQNPNDDMAAAVAAHQRGKLEAAEQLYIRVLRRAPHYASAHCGLGIALVQQGKATAALKPLATAVQAMPTSFEAQSHYGLALLMSGAHAQGLVHLDRALAINPRDADVLQNRGNALKLLGRYVEAVESFDRAITLIPQNPALHSARGVALTELGRFSEAIASYDHALSIDPDYADAHENRGNALNWLGRHADAVESYRRALALRPESADLHYALAFTHLRHGECRDGFKEYEWRLRLEEARTGQSDFGRPLWLGMPSLEGRSILLHSEQGLGDTLQFARYVPLVAAQGARVVLRVQPALKTLLGRLAGAAAVIDRSDTVPPTDLRCPLPSLPLALGTDLTSIPSPGAYVAAPADAIERWRGRIPEARLRVGIAWCGNPQFRNDRLRSMTLAQVRPLFDVPGVAFISLNPGILQTDIAALAAMPNVTHLAKDFRDFTDTAAVMACLDLVITTDTSIAHLAGAMARPVWIMLATSADWRWLAGRQDSPWYPTARLFQQPSFGDWAGVVAAVARELRSQPDRA